MKKDRNIDELFREKLLNYEQEPPAYLLENILSGAARARRKRKIVLWRVIGVAAALILAFIAGWQLKYLNNGTVDQTVVVSQNSTTEPKSAITIVPETKIAETNIHEIQAVANNETSGKTQPGNNLQAGNLDSSLEETIMPASVVATRTDESDVLRPIEALKRLIVNHKLMTNVLHEIKLPGSSNNQQELTLDQQIIEQNQQLLLAQNEIQKKSHWLVGAQVSPAYSVSRSSHSQTYASNMVSSSSSNPVDLGGGISIEYKKGKRWSLQSGVYYSGMAQTSGNSAYSNRNLVASPDFASEHGVEYFNAPVNIDSRSSKMMMNSVAGVIEFSGVPTGIVLGTNLEDKTLASSAVVVSDARFIQNFEYIEIPLYLRYTILDSRFDVEMLGGFSSNLLVGNETFMESGNNKSSVGKTKDMEFMNYSGTLGVGFKYGLSKRIYLNVEPRVKYYLNSLNSNSSVTYKPYSIGVFTGLSYEF